MFESRLRSWCALVCLAGGCFSPTGSGTSGTDGSDGSSSTAATTSGDPGGSSGLTTSEPSTTSPSPTTGDATDTATTESGAITDGGSSGGSPCGDGSVDPGEDCDDGASNGDDKPCTAQCRFNVCGDGLPCTDCVEQECDDGNMTPGDGCTPECRFEKLYVFVTSGSWTGKELGGVAGADQRCNDAAMTNKALGGRKFRAWLSEDGKDAITRIGASNVPYVRLDSVQVAPNVMQFTTGTLASSIDVTEAGDPAGAPGICSANAVWTGTMADGTLALDNCMGWSGAGALGRIGGFSSNGAEWTDCDTLLCGMPARLYCVQVVK